MNAARAIMKDYRGNKPKETQEAPPDIPPEGDMAVPSSDTVFTEPAGDIAPDLPPPEAETKPHPPTVPVERMPVKHKQVDVHDIFDEIYSYLTALENRIKELGPEAEQARIDEIKKEATLDIISLIHKRIDNA
jgi:hypothetical protein